MSFCAASSKRYISATLRLNVTFFVSPGASSTFSKPLSCFAGVVPFPAAGCETYNCTTSFPDTEPVFLTLTEIVTLSFASAFVLSTDISEYWKFV